MFERYTERARRVIFFARYEASQLGSNSIETEHLLLGLIREGKGLTSRIFSKSHLSMESIRKEIEGRALYRDKVSTSVDIPLSVDSKRVLGYASEEAERMLHNYIGTEHILLGLLREEKSVASSILAEKGMRLSAVREDIVQLLNEKANLGKAKETPLLSEFSRDLTEAAARGSLDPLVGREDELARIVQVLCRRTRNNPVLIGEPGVGKTALVEGLANKIVQGDVPVYLAEKRILALDISLIVAGTKYRGQFEERLKTIMRELTESHNIIIFIDELHTLVGAGSAEGSLDAANILKPALSRGEIQCIGATTPAEYRKYIEKDRSLERRFQAVKVASPTEEETIQILRGIKDRYEKFHHVAYEDEALEAAVYQSSRYITDRFLPDKAIDLLDEAGSRVKLRDATAIEEAPEFSRKIRVVVDRGDSPSSAFFRDEEVAQRENLQIVREHWDMASPGAHQVTKGDIDDVVSKWTGIPISALKEEESAKLLRMEDELHRRIVSQDNAISAVARAIRRTRAGLKSPARPVGSFLFLGPTGVGKTEVARSLAGFLFGSERALVRFDMSEYMEKHAVSKLIGSPPGYVGHEEGGQLTERVKRNPYSVVLLDEIEKAHPDIFNVLLQVFEDGHLTDGLGNTIDFKNAIIIMTSNIGARFIEKKGRMGFAAGEKETSQSVNEMVMGEVKRTFNPEFINRLDEIIIFDALTEQDLVRITRLLVEQLNANLKERGISISIKDDGVNWLLQKTLPDRSYGARPLRRAIQRHIEDALSEAFIRGQIRPQRPIEIGVQDAVLWYWQEGRGGALSGVGVPA
jgi:ATP-dependent Clp protease ATP-binding subunit ClpC